MADIEREPTTEFAVNPQGEGPAFAPKGFTALQKGDRFDIVNQTSTGAPADRLQVDHLELSALGTNVDLVGYWTNPNNSFARWHEVGQGGRVVRSTLTFRGYLFPLGHRAVYTSTTFRSVAVDPTNARSDPANYPVAWLKQESIIKVHEQVKSYPALGQPFPEAVGTSDWPFATVRLIETETPLIDDPNSHGHFLIPAPPRPNKKATTPEAQAFWPTIDDQDFLWNFVATDLGGHEVAFRMPLVFVFGYDGASYIGSQYDATTAPSPGAPPTPRFTEMLADAYLQALTTPDSTGVTHPTYSTTGGALVRFAPESGGAQGGSTHPTLLVELGAATAAVDHNAPTTPAPTVTAAELQGAEQPDFYPTIKSARIRVHAAEVITGNGFSDAGGANDPAKVGGVQFHFYPGYVVSGSTNFGKPPAAPAATTAPAATHKMPPNLGSVYFASGPGATSSVTAAAKSLGMVPLNLPASMAGGVGTPNLGITGLSSAVGSVGGDLDTYANNAAADVGSYFPSDSSTASAAEQAAAAAAMAAGQALSQLLGGLNLGDILSKTGFAMPTLSSAVDAAESATGSVLPALVPGVDPSDLPTLPADPAAGVHNAHYNLNTPLGSWPSDAPIFLPDPDGGGMMTLETMVSTTVTPGTVGMVPSVTTPTYTVNGSIDPFTVYLIGQGSSTDFLSLHFASFTFSGGSGHSPTVNVNLDAVTFDGCLSFVNALESLLESLGGSGLSIDIEPTSLTVGISIALPDIGSGFFNLSGLSLVAGVTIPFLSGMAVATFGFSSKDDPFTITVAMFGGGGFVSLAVGFGGVVSVHVQLEFTGQLALNVGVASGAVTLSAGIYISYATTGGATLSGFVNINGQIVVFGVLTISCTVNLSLTYASANNSVVGSATFHAGVSICGFSKTVSFGVTKTFAGGAAQSMPMADARSRQVLAGPLTAAGDTEVAPTTANLINPASWRAYCAAFAPTSANTQPA